MVKVTAQQFIRIWNELPNPNNVSFRNEPTRRFKASFLLDKLDLKEFVQKADVLGLNQIIVPRPEELEFYLDMTSNGWIWRLATSVIIEN
jgi:hypothetical protein